MHKIEGVLQHYPWGHRTAIAELRGVEPSGQPEAELWLGAHPRGPSRMANGSVDGTTLDAVIAADPAYWLGATIRERFGELPFLLKILAADQPLSIQAHPNPAQARAGFEREDRAGIERDAYKRNYRDPNHKPELICALSPFEAKCGFRPLADTCRLLAMFTDPVIEPLRTRLGRADAPSTVLRATTSWLLTLEHGDVTDLVAAVVNEAERLLVAWEGHDAVEEFRADLEWTARINGFHPADVGVVVALLLNHLTLAPGQAMYLEAGLVHAYLSGTAVELMANSDNVLRGGLTAKHVDVDELMAVATFEPHQPAVQKMSGATHRFDVPVPEFSLVAYRFSAHDDPRACTVEGPEIVLVESGSTTVVPADPHRNEPVRLAAGEAAVVPAAAGRYQLAPSGADSMVWRATVGR